MNDIGARIKEARLSLKKSQRELADELGITKQAISNIENEKCAPGVALLSKLLLDYSINLNYIVGAQGSMYTSTDKSYKTIRETIISEVEKMLTDRGID